MNRHEKIAYYNLAVIAVSVLCFAIFFSVLRQTHPLEASFRIASSAFGILGFIGFGQTLFRKEGSEKRIVGFFDPELDERDIEIYRRAGLHAFSTLWGFCVLAIMGIWMYFRWKHGLEGPVTIALNVDLLPFLLFPCFVLITFVYSISIVLQQRRGSSDDTGYEGFLVPNTRSLIISLLILPVFILFGISIALHGEIVFAFLFITLGFGSCALTFHEIRKRRVYSQSNTAVHRIVIMARLINVVFTFLFAGLVVIFLRSMVELESIRGLNFASLFILIVIGLIFFITVVADLKHYLRERRHEKA